jgi:D-aspartate ligase
MNKTCCLILGGYVNGYCIIKELYDKGLREIVLFDNAKNIAAFSNKIKRFVKLKMNFSDLYDNLIMLHDEYNQIVVYPTHDFQIEMLHEIYDKINHFCFLPFNNNNVIECMDKCVQYSYCEQLGVPYPKTKEIIRPDDIEKILSIPFPLIIKPKKREDLKTNVFRSLQITSEKHYQKETNKLKSFLKQGIEFIVSEIIPGDGSNIYAYVGYRNKKGLILNEWAGKKLSQYPNDFGVFSSASNQAPLEVILQGRTLLEGMDLYGINEPEFKYDYRDGKYKLMEINLRSMMWHRVGNISGVNLQYTQYLDAVNGDIEKQKQEKDKNIHFVYFKHEIINLLSRKGYFRVFFNNLFKCDKRSFAVFDKYDLKPFLVDILFTLRSLIAIWLRILKIR